MASRRQPAAPPERQTPPLNDELLEDIFLRLSSPIDLARVSASCFAFRHVISEPHFLRQYRAIHPPLLLGCLLDGFRPGGFRPAVAPHPNATAARALAGATTGFNFNYLPLGRWMCTDICDGRVLLRQRCNGSAVSPDLAVCDPLSRRYLLIPPIPDDIIASTHVQKRGFSFGAFLVPSSNLEDTWFKVVARMSDMERLVIYIFSSEFGYRSVGTSTSWGDVGVNDPATSYQYWARYDHRCFLWNEANRNQVLKLDINTMEFSSTDLPPGDIWRHVVTADAAEGRLAMFTMIKNSTTVSYYTKNEGQRTNEWQLEKTIPLPCQCKLLCASAGYIFLMSTKKRDMTIFSAIYSLEIKTLKVERLCSTEMLYAYHVHPYFGFPPFLSLRRI
ncbi:hypothetical protein PR202_gb21208 [Eleusine coracana subsp. coracana]|uniref:F-box domain-containing protein n=1 Tax=Eleusine coracana subsp. coracana TaxID=191504 RepID=A0AAV5FEK1_ELECO|nr:hypothetical protein QOZ80_7BG0603530 [Eleusine coracana subsp. coracana]GJN32686.1 hypothetical protein PR202_gb21208 [Eleusine coracana subsp. coracana]